MFQLGPCGPCGPCAHVAMRPGVVAHFGCGDLGATGDCTLSDLGRGSCLFDKTDGLK